MHQPFRQIEDLLASESFRNYAAGSCEADVQRWEQWLKDHPEHASMVEEARDMLTGIHFVHYQATESDKVDSWHAIQQRLSEFSDSHHPTKQASIFSLTGSYRMAAMILMLVCIGLGYHFLKQATSPLPEPSLEWLEITSAVDKRKVVHLSDSSMVYLNGDSRLRYPKEFSGNQREVFLEGEAFFEVARCEHQEFVVITDQLTTRVLGTSFNVKAYPDKSSVEVAVTTGKVKILAHETEQEKELTLVPSELGVYDRQQKTTYKTHFQANEVLAWKRTTLTFSDASLEEVARKLAHQYGLRIEIQGKSRVTHQFNGSFKDQSLKQILEGWSFASEFSYQLQNDTVFIRL